MSSQLVEAYTNALRALGAKEGRPPRGLVRRAVMEGEDIDPGLDVTEPRLLEYLASSDVDDKLRVDLHLSLAKWDNARGDSAEWTSTTPPNTEHRRSRVIELLELGSQAAKELADHFPIAKGDETTVIAGPWEPWYTTENQYERNFYWGHYIDYLREQRGWGAEALSNLDTATTHVVERLVDPSRSDAGRTKGLVVGYVQSGKTANFTGVIAKAVDAGYRLIIVMTGTTNLLREQTQRRLDMELVGRENVLRGIDENDLDAGSRIDYLEDKDWIEGRFVSHGVRPSDINKPDIHRMTTRNIDYRKLNQGLPALEFERRDRMKPLWHPDNLFTSHARLIVVKKNSSVLKNLVTDLKNNSDRLEHIPALIIDDESDQASVNTTDPKKWVEENKKRTAINQHLSDLLRMLPRAQYVGYTATPMANVFVDPTDAQDIFPKDYLISLPRPTGYMGAEDFHDLDMDPEEEKTFANSKEAAHLRLVGKDDEEQELKSALDTFVLSGAIKLYREAHGVKPFKHHTMLVHETMRTAAQKTRADAIQDLWQSGGYFSGGAATRLRVLFDEDIRAVSDALHVKDPTPVSFEELRPYLGAVARKIAPSGNPVLVVNSDKDIEQEDLDFDKRSIWRVLVGGNKLARGFTVEGLTVSYYSRAVGHAEALMQMGRWFGFRAGYQDLVRLFVTPKVRDAFEAACRDEEHFRGELRQYAMMADGKPTITPLDIPPLVIRHGLRPTAANKMYNARLVERRSRTKEPSSGYPDLNDQATLNHNIDACVPLLNAATQPASLKGGNRTFEALTGTVSHQEFMDVLGQLKWATSETFKADHTWMATLPEDVIDQWTIMLPQQKTGRRIKIRDAGQFSVHGRKPDRGGKSIRGNSESAHRAAVEKLLEGKPTTGCAILYPVVSTEVVKDDIEDDGQPTGVVMALMLQLPESAVPVDGKPLVYQVVVEGQPLYAIVES